MPVIDLRKGRDAHPASSARTESVLQEHDIAYTFEPNLALDEVRAPEGHHVRLIEHRAPTQLVKTYAVQMRQGAAFPAMVVSETFGVIDGNTRLAAALECGWTTIPAYVCSGLSEVQMRTLSIALNQTHGQRMTRAEIRSFVVSCARSGIDVDPRTCARITGEKPSAIARWLTIERCRSRAAARGLSLATVSDSGIMALAPARLDRVFVELVDLATSGAPASALRRTVSEANAADSEADAAAVITRAKTEAGLAAQSDGVRCSVRPALHVGGLLRFNVDDLLDVAPDKRPEAYADLRMVRDVLAAAVSTAEVSWRCTRSVSPAEELLDVA